MKRYVLIKVLRFLGVFRLLRWLNRNSVTILYVHGIAEAEEGDKWWPTRMPHATVLLKRQLETISRYYRWISLDDAAEMISGRKKLEPYSMVLTFDDGYRNNMTEALPLALAHGIKPVFYITTGFVDNRKPFWFDRFDYIIQKIREPETIEICGIRFEFRPDDRAATARTYSDLRAFAKSHFTADEEFVSFFDSTCSRLEQKYGESLASLQSRDKWSATLSEADLRSLSDTGEATIGSHTVDHVRLDVIDPGQRLRQLVDSKEYLESVTGSECVHFCYPNGNLNRDTAKMAEEVGYRTATTTVPGFNVPGDDPFRLKRMHLPNYADESRLLALLSGFYGLRDRIMSRSRAVARPKRALLSGSSR